MSREHQTIPHRLVSLTGAQQPGWSFSAAGVLRSAVLAGSIVCSLCLNVWVMANDLGVGVFQEYYQNDLLRGYSTSAVSWIPSLEIFFMMAMVCIHYSLQARANVF